MQLFTRFLNRFYCSFFRFDWLECTLLGGLLEGMALAWFENMERLLLSIRDMEKELSFCSDSIK